MNLVRVSLIDVDGKMPNLALMKLSAWHKSQGDSVEWYNPIFSKSDVIYASKVFTFTPDYGYYPDNTIKGGTGYEPFRNPNVGQEALDTHANIFGLNGRSKSGGTGRISPNLDEKIDALCPDYSLYFCNYSIGFLTRGCPNKCPWCVVPEKEGDIRPNADIHEFLRHDKVVLLDNNVLAHKHGIEQIEKMAKLRIKVDFNQGLDARLIDKQMARRLAELKWLRPVRLACDSAAQKPFVKKAVALLREAGCTPKRYFCYVLVKDVEDAFDRVEFLRGLNVDPFAQPYRDRAGTEPTREQKDFARWVNHKAAWKKVKWEDYKYNKGAPSDALVLLRGGGERET